MAESRVVARRRGLRRVVTDALGAALATHRLMAVVRAPDAAAARRSLETLATAGFRLAEVSLTTPDAPAVIADTVAALGAALVLGAGTVRSADDARAAADAGACFVVSPALGPGIDTARALRLPVLPGVLTPTEAETAWRQGASALKLFPATAGGPPYLAAIRQPLPEVPFVPVGGVRLEEVRDWLDAGAVALGVGGPLLGDAATGGDQAELAGRARRWLDAIEEWGCRG